ncbi:GNAT family N-acetyltransferase [Virgibacillus ainsalahensis]
MGFVIRKMRKKDIIQVRHVAKTSWNATYAGIIPIEIQKKFLENAYSDKTMKRRLKHTNLFVAEDIGKIVGFANFSNVNDEGEVELGAIYLYPEYQGKGIGTALLYKGIQKFAGVKEVHLNVEKNNEIGKTFYQAKGFEVDSEFEDNFDGHILHTLRMVLKVQETMKTS